MLPRVYSEKVSLTRISGVHYIRLSSKLRKIMNQEYQGEVREFQLYYVRPENKALDNKNGIILLLPVHTEYVDGMLVSKVELGPLEKILHVLNMPVLDFLNQPIDEIFQRIVSGGGGI